MTEKEIDDYLVVDWKDGSTRTRKSKPGQSDLGTNEVFAQLDLTIDIPDVDVSVIAATIDVPEPRVRAATLDAIDEEDLPDWTDFANQTIEDHDYLVEDDSEPKSNVVDIITGRIMVNSNSRPDPELVQEYVSDTVGEMRGADA